MHIFRSATEMRQHATKVKKQRNRITFVPTMGALHEGHLELVRHAKKIPGITVVSVFVNPTQFGPHEDFRRYPRNFGKDRRLLASAGVDVVFAPRTEDIYPREFDTYIVPEKIATILEGKCRPGHFRGVATVVYLLFKIVQPDVAIFGQKDIQQVTVIKQMVRDLWLPVSIEVLPTVRDRDGLALSSRNAYLSAEARVRALEISRSLFASQEMILAGERSADKIRNFIRRRLVKYAGAKVDYVSVAAGETLAELATISGKVAISLACTIDGVRLIDNVILKV